ncbi:hypothetical protein JCGZ_12645 [Jatropha curcas]|uniref:Secreted protein n=1 Tax=Jatropha curcas TaxID=180498 RepID=A0A067KDX6_JATCU|nr:hypothetical protein JCGZ_12645 [Jatropha curcas]
MGMLLNTAWACWALDLARWWHHGRAEVSTSRDRQFPMARACCWGHGLGVLASEPARQNLVTWHGRAEVHGWGVLASDLERRLPLVSTAMAC